MAFEFVHGGFFRDFVILAEFELVSELLALLRQRRFHLVGVCRQTAFLLVQLLLDVLESLSLERQDLIFLFQFKLQRTNFLLQAVVVFSAGTNPDWFKDHALRIFINNLLQICAAPTLPLNVIGRYGCRAPCRHRWV